MFIIFILHASTALASKLFAGYFVLSLFLFFNFYFGLFGYLVTRILTTYTEFAGMAAGGNLKTEITKKSRLLMLFMRRESIVFGPLQRFHIAL